MLFDELQAARVAEATTGEPETPAPSASESDSQPVEEAVETTLEPETPEADTSDQPGEEGEPPRAQKRIQELIKKNKELEEKASYWDALQAKLPESSEDSEEDGAVTVESIAKAVKNELKADQIEQTRREAESEMQRDAIAAIEAHPQLAEDDELATMVVSYAKERKISFKAAADRVIGRLQVEAKKAETKTAAAQRERAGAATPATGRVSSGAMPPANVSNMSEEDKATSWDQIIASYTR